MFTHDLRPGGVLGSKVVDLWFSTSITRPFVRPHKGESLKQVLNYSPADKEKC